MMSLIGECGAGKVPERGHEGGKGRREGSHEERRRWWRYGSESGRGREGGGYRPGIKHDELLIKNDEIALNMMSFVFKITDLGAVLQAREGDVSKIDEFRI